MAGRTSDWNEELGHFLKPFLDRLGHEARRQMCPLYISGLIGPGDHKSIQAMAKRLALGEYDGFHPTRTSPAPPVPPAIEGRDLWASWLRWPVAAVALR